VAAYGGAVVTRLARKSPRVGAGTSPEAVDLVDGAEIVDALIVGDLSARVASLVDVAGCRIESARLIGTHLTRSRFTDCVLVGCDLSGVVLDDCSCTRVEFRRCRLTGIQAGGGRFRDVAFVDCTLDDANFRMTQWERAEFEGTRMMAERSGCLDSRSTSSPIRRLPSPRPCCDASCRRAAAWCRLI
jgi:hypothetical protein